jgi:hypothetical protein
MLSVASAFTAEEKDSTRKIVASSRVAWKKSLLTSIRRFTIGVSTIGGTDVIASSGGTNSDFWNYQYQDESAYLMSLSYERSLQMPAGGINKGLAEVEFDNTSGRYTPRYMGGSSELYTAVQKPRRPLVLNAGFNFNGVDQMIPQFVGLTSKVPEVSAREKRTKIQAEDFVGFLQNRYVDNTTMFTAQRTDQVIENILQRLGYGTAQYNLDYGINNIPFGIYEQGTRYIDIIQKLVQAENGQFYQDEEGILRFENRQHWDSAPYTQVQKVITTSMVLEAKMPDDSHIINVVEVVGSPREKQATQRVFQGSGFAGVSAIQIPAGGTKEQWVSYDDPMLQITTPTPATTSGDFSYFAANAASDGTGADLTASVYVKSIENFARASKIVFGNTSASIAFITKLDIWGRPARRSGDIYARNERGASVTAYEERPYKLENEYIQSNSWAESYTNMILRDFAFPENIQDITIRAIPELQLGDLISWQGRYWRIFGIKSKIAPSVGFVQDLKLLQRTITSYFRIGISTIGGSDLIAP